MQTNSLGFIFECRYDCNKSIGVLQSFKCGFRRDRQTVELVCPVGSDGRIIIPAYINPSLGFRPLTDMCTDLESVRKYVRSNKPVFGVLGSFAMIANVTLVYNINTGELLEDDSIIRFYIPKAVPTNMFVDGDKPVIVCEKVDCNNGINVMKVSKTIYDAYKKTFLSCLSKEITYDRLSFISSLVIPNAGG